MRAATQLPPTVYRTEEWMEVHGHKKDSILRDYEYLQIGVIARAKL